MLLKIDWSPWWVTKGGSTWGWKEWRLFKKGTSRFTWG